MKKEIKKQKNSLPYPIYSIICACIIGNIIISILQDNWFALLGWLSSLCFYLSNIALLSIRRIK